MLNIQLVDQLKLKLNLIKNWCSHLLSLRILIGVSLFFLVGDYLMFKNYGENWDNINSLIFRLSNTLEFYIVVGFALWLANKIKKFRLLISLPVIVFSFMVFASLYYAAKDVAPSLRTLFTILDFICFALFFTPIILIGTWLITARIWRTKTALCIGIGIISAIVFAFYFKDIRLFTSTTYYQTINPQAGAHWLEELYKENYSQAQNALDEANLTISEMTQYATDITSIFGYQEKARGLFSKRDAYFTEMVRIDNETTKLRLDSRYREFYRKRKLADENDYEAFKIYRGWMQNQMDGVLSYYKFTDSYAEAMEFLSILNSSDGFTQENVEHFENLALSLNLQHNEVDSLAKRDVFTKDLADLMNDKNEVVKLFNELNNAVFTGNKAVADEVMKKFRQKAKTETPNENELIVQWAREKGQPVFDEQDKKHRYSLDLYNQTYTYAHNERLDSIISVWNSKMPGTTEDNKPVI